MAANPQGSKAGLVVAVVVFVLLFVLSTIFAIYFNAQFTKEQVTVNEERAKSAQLVNDADLASPEVQRYIQAAKKPEAAFNVVLHERSSLSRAIVGTPSPTSQAEAAADAALKYATQRLNEAKAQGVTVPTDLSTAVRNLADAIVRLNGEKAKALAAAETSSAAAAKTTAERDALLKDKDDQIAKAGADRDKAVAEIEEWRKAKGTDITQIQADADAKLKEVQAATATQQVEINKRDGQIKSLTKEVDSLRNRLKGTRVATAEAVVQQADGKIIRIPSQDTVFINVGQQQSVTLGLTFEVYDKEKGIPALGDGLRATELPVGKASIEVIHVLPTSSECRVVRHTVGQNLTEGDLIKNLVFDPNTHYKFLVYGDFDLSHTGSANPADADVVKRLIVQWGGRLVNSVSVDTDFVVMGNEPVVPVLTKDDENDPTKVQRRDAEQAKLDAYLDIQSKAVQLGIPLLNQNRFLYFIGYYDLASR